MHPPYIGQHFNLLCPPIESILRGTMCQVVVVAIHKLCQLLLQLVTFVNQYSVMSYILQVLIVEI